MTVYTITQGDTTLWTVNFIDPITKQTLPVSGGTLSLSYRSNKLPASNNITLTLNSGGAFWTATWNSTTADLGYGSWSVFSADAPSAAAASGTMRIVADP